MATAAAAALTIPQAYGWDLNVASSLRRAFQSFARPAAASAVVAASAMGFTATALGAGIGGARKKLFGKVRLRRWGAARSVRGLAMNAIPPRFPSSGRAGDFDERADVKAIKDEIKKAFPDHKPIADGYPDMGSGLFARLLKPAEWYEFNLAQRAHHNTLENLTFAITLVLTAGLFQPEAAAACGVVFCIG
ncbi:unnamed protein product, partial [Symbiodinium sp. KB8]